MKKNILIVLFVIGMAVVSNAAVTIQWTYNANLGASYSAGWLVQMYQDVGVNDTLSLIVGFAADGTPIGGNAAGDLVLTSYHTPLTSSKGNINWTLNGYDVTGIKGDNVYTVIFNATSIALATQAVVVDSTTFAISSSDPSTGTYALTTVANSFVPVAAVPEPSSVALIGVGLAAIALRRRFAK